MKLTGGCQCGSVRYEITANRTGLYVCHCRECQKQSSSAFGISVIVPAQGFALKQGRIKEWTRGTDSGRALICMFCADCGSRVWHAATGIDTVSVKGGSLDEPVDLGSAVHIWTTRKLPGVLIPEGARQFPGEPD